MRSSRRQFITVVVAGVVVSGVVGALAATGDASFDWLAAVGAATAYGTLALALVTWGLVQSARDDAEETRALATETRKLASLAEREQQARLRPFVYPYPDADWLPKAWQGESLPMRNDGAGVALNVEVQVYWPPSNAALAVTSLAPGEERLLFARSKIESWDRTWGLATYTDLVGRKWETRFTVEKPGGGQLVMQMCAYGLAELLPQLAYPAGWEMPNARALIRLPDE